MENEPAASGGCGGTSVTLGSKGRVRRGRLAVSKSPPSVRLARVWPRSADSAGRPNQRLAFGGPPRTRPDVSIGPLWSGPEVVGLNRPGSDTGADYSPSARRVGAPPGLRRCARLRPRAIPAELGRQCTTPSRRAGRLCLPLRAPASHRFVGVAATDEVAGSSPAPAHQRGDARNKSGV